MSFTLNTAAIRSKAIVWETLLMDHVLAKLLCMLHIHVSVVKSKEYGRGGKIRFPINVSFLF